MSWQGAGSRSDFRVLHCWACRAHVHLCTLTLPHSLGAPHPSVKLSSYSVTNVNGYITITLLSQDQDKYKECHISCWESYVSLCTDIVDWTTKYCFWLFLYYEPWESVYVIISSIPFTNKLQKVSGKDGTGSCDRVTIQLPSSPWSYSVILIYDLKSTQCLHFVLGPQLAICWSYLKRSFPCCVNLFLQEIEIDAYINYLEDVMNFLS